jgi:hypothetical protein
MEFEACLPCSVGLFQECLNPQPIGETGNYRPCGVLPDFTKEPQVKGLVGRPLSEPADMADVLTTGRKRAAMMYPIYDGMVCEWAGLKFAGGGIKPIIGCPGNLLYAERGKYARHHGPDKNVLENGPGNVHRICPFCHNRWHAENNEFYGIRPAEGQPFLPITGTLLKHNSETMATEEEIEENEARWKLRKIERTHDDD